jgi:hypothetical protein
MTTHVSRKKQEYVYLRDWTERWFDRLVMGVNVLDLVKLVVISPVLLFLALAGLLGSWWNRGESGKKE